MEQYKVIIKNYKTGEIVKEMGPMPERKADKVEMGMLINLNTDEYCVYTERIPKHWNQS